MPLPMRPTPTTISLATLALAALLGGCGKKAAAPQMPPPAVSVITVKSETVPVSNEFIGRAVSPYDVELRAQVSGTIKEKLMKDGATVKAGDLLFVIDDVPYRAAYDNAKALVAQRESALVNAERTLARLKSVSDPRAVSDKDLDDAINAVTGARAALHAAQSGLTKAQWDLDNTRIKAPVAGTLGKSPLEAGAPVVANGAPVVRLQQYDPIWVTFTIPESNVLKLAQGIESKRIVDADPSNLRANLMLTDGTKYPVTGRMNFSDVNVRTDVAAIDARAVFANPDRTLMPGQFFRVTLSGPKKQGVFLVPQRAVQVNPSDCSVIVVAKAKDKEGREYDAVERRVVATGEWIGDKWVIESGLKDGDRLVVEGYIARMMPPGAPVRVSEYNPSAPAAAKAAAGDTAKPAAK